MNHSKEAVLNMLISFADQKPIDIPELLEDYLTHIAKTGDTVFPWEKLKPLLHRKLELVMDEFYITSPVEPDMPNVPPFDYEEMSDFILEALDRFDAAPFTIQRLCELVIDPRKHYSRIDKFMRAVEKSVLVVSTIEPRSLAQPDNAAARPVANGARGAGDDGVSGRFARPRAGTRGWMDWERRHCE